MQPRRQQGQEEHQQDLSPDGGAHLPAAHAYLLHDLIAALILIALGDLLVVDDEHRGHQEQQSQEDAQEQEAAVHCVEFLRHLLAAGHAVSPIGDCQNGLGAGQLFAVGAVGVQVDAEGPAGQIRVHQMLCQGTVRHQAQHNLVGDDGAVPGGEAVQPGFHLNGCLLILIKEGLRQLKIAVRIGQHLVFPQGDSFPRQAAVLLRR